MAKKIIKARLKQRTDTQANWAANNPVLLEGELGLVTDDKNLYKVGDGVTAWNDLPFRGFDGTLVHETGDSDNAAMSQRGVTQALAELKESMVEKVPGKGLSTEDYTTEEKEKLAGLQNFNDAEIKDKLAELSGKTYNFFSYTSEGNYAVFTDRIGFKLKAGAKIVNKGETLLIIANNISLEARYDLQPNQELILDSDKGYIGVGKDGGLVAFEYYYEPLAMLNQQSFFELRETTSKEIKDVAKEFNTIFTSVNLIDPSQVAYGTYIYQGQVFDNKSYNTTGYIRVQEGESYALVATEGYYSQARARFISFFDADKVWVSDGATDLKEVVIPSNVAYIRVSYVTSLWEFAQINIGNAVSYQSYKKIIAPTLIDTKTLDLTFINKMSSFRGVATLGASQKIELQENYVSRNVEVSGIIKGNIESVEIGLGKGSFYGGHIELTPTHMYVFVGSSKVSEHEHGLTLGEKVFVSIRTAKEPNSYNNKTATIELRTQGQVFSKENIYYVGRGAAFIQNNGNSSLEVSLSFLPCYINAPIWMFGDSYFEWADKTRWITQAIQDGNKNFMDSALSGGTSYDAMTAFSNLLLLGLPKMAVLCTGMNDGSDTADAPSASWLSNIKSFVTTCNNSNITPILATIPSVPSVNNEKKNEWVRNSGYRYIDFAAAVGATSNGQWDEGLLSADGVHPSEQGGIMLYAQALVDCPEIANS